ncbi:MAG: hypothetical protein UT05_C0004G0045 [Parcubacteria group bacterium GW2011_GWF2_38_76]|nr:MAG: hypothetical protein UT05_C0004G0045 [Parcubacteria group bacterium GW2011_GWF2_38_76]HBM45651.1 hypothetical protein [Patescibacteria group bacterium]
MSQGNWSFVDLVKKMNDELETKENKTKKAKRCYLFKGDILSYKGKKVSGVKIENEESFVIIFDEDILVVELDQEYEKTNRPPRYSLFTSLIDNLRGKKVVDTELLSKDSFKLVFDDGDSFIVRTKLINEKSKDKNRTLEAVLISKDGNKIVLF